MTHRFRVAAAVSIMLLTTCLLGTAPLSATAMGASWAVGGAFSTPNGTGFWLTQLDGSILAVRQPGRHGAAVYSNGQLMGGAANRDGRGYWVTADDGGVFSLGNAKFYGSTGGLRLNAPVRSMRATSTGRGYWLVAADGGVFSFGDAKFYGSTGNRALNQPIVGMTAARADNGYRLVARDGGIFTFGRARFYGSLPGHDVAATDVIGMASTPTNKGYWIARADGHVYAFGNARTLGSATSSACDPVTAIISNPRAQGYRLALRSGATIPFGKAPGGPGPTGKALECPSFTDVITTSGRIGQLQLGVSTASDIISHLGTPEASGVSTFEVPDLPGFQALGYDCAPTQIPGGSPIHPYPTTRGPYCRTLYYINRSTGRLAGFGTTSTRYATAAGTTIGTTVGEALRRERQPQFYPYGCNVGISLGDEHTAAQIELFTGQQLTDAVDYIAVDTNTNSVGVLFC
jgi:hypothetical protein